MNRVVKIDVKNINVGTGFLISLEDDKEKDLVLTVGHIFGEVKAGFWEMWDIATDDINVISEHYRREFKVMEVLYKECDAEEKDIALIYIEKISDINSETNLYIPDNNEKFISYDVTIEGFGQVEKNNTSRVINGKIYGFINEEKKMYRINYIESDRVESTPSIEVNKGMSGAPAFVNYNGNMFFIGIQKMVSSCDSTDGILGVFTYEYCIKLVKELYDVEIRLKNFNGKVINNDALFDNIHVIEQKFTIVNNKNNHIGASIKFEDIRELRDEFIGELIDTIADWVYSTSKYNEIKEKSICRGKTEKAAVIEITRMIKKKFRTSGQDIIYSQGKIAELLLFHFIQRYFKAIPLLRKANIEKNNLKDSTVSNVIHYKKEEENNIIVLGEARSFSSGHDLKEVYKIAINSILEEYNKIGSNIELYMYEDFLERDMIEVAQSYLNKTMKNKRFHLVQFIIYDETCRLDFTDEQHIINQIDGILFKRYKELENENKEINTEAILSRITYILFPVWGIEALSELFLENF